MSDVTNTRSVMSQCRRGARHVMICCVAEHPPERDDVTRISKIQQRYSKKPRSSTKKRKSYQAIMTSEDSRDNLMTSNVVTSQDDLLALRDSPSTSSSSSGCSNKGTNRKKDSTDSAMTLVSDFGSEGKVLEERVSPKRIKLRRLQRSLNRAICTRKKHRSRIKKVSFMASLLAMVGAYVTCAASHNDVICSNAQMASLVFVCFIISFSSFLLRHRFKKLSPIPKMEEIRSFVLT